jgi:uncharacterized membrane protein YeaQ/YmgE (transglycosylase-associated protein family)
MIGWKGRGVLVSILELLVLLLVAALCGALGQMIVGYSRGGCLVSIALGFVGAFIGVFLARLTGLPEFFSVQIENVSFAVVWSVIGAALFVLVIGLLRGRRASD